MCKEDLLPERLIRFCGANCGDCDKYRRFLAGDESELVNPEQLSLLLAAPGLSKGQGLSN